MSGLGIIYVMFFFSGLTALVYEVLWTRMFTLVFGVTTLAISTVLTCFFAGLAIGSYAVGRWIDRRNEFLKWYGWAELSIGIIALLFPFFLSIISKVYVFLSHNIELGLYQSSLIKFILSAFLLIPPTSLMGATLPILGKFLVKNENQIAGNLGRLYAINTFGAVVGTMATGFVLIPLIGMKAILFTAGILNIAVGLGALMLNKYLTTNKEINIAHIEDPLPSSNSPPSGIFPPRYLSLILWSFSLSGFTALAYEVIWSRVLEVVFTGTIYAFTTILTTFLIGIAVGSSAFSWYLNRPHTKGKEGNLFALVEIGIGFSTILLIFLYNRITDLGLYKKTFETTSWIDALVIKFFISFALLSLPTFLFGATFPIICNLYSRNIKTLGHSVGSIYSVNTIGGIFGSFLTGFLFIPLIGMQRSIVLMGCINLIIGISLLIFSPYSSRMFKLSTSIASIIFILSLLNFLPGNMVKSIHTGLLGKKESIVYYKEGISATVMISERKGMSLATSNKRLWVNGNQATAAFYEGLQINRFQGVLPIVLHPDPKDILVICFGSGTTFGTLSLFDVNKVDNVEIAKEVVQGAGYFAKENQNVLHNPKSNIIINDGRNYLLTTTKKYDIITQEPMHPSLVGVVNLYTREYYELSKARLKPGGIISQWIPLYNLSVKDVKTLVKTFQSVFPHTSIWITNVDIFLIGTSEKIEIDFKSIKSRLSNPAIQDILRDVDLNDAVEFVGSFLMNEERVMDYSAGAPAMDDNWPYVEFYGPKSFLSDTVLPNIIELLEYRESLDPYIKGGDGEEDRNIRADLDKKFQAAEFNLIGRAYVSEGDFKSASALFERALAIDPSNNNSLHYKRRLRLMMLGL